MAELLSDFLNKQTPVTPSIIGRGVLPLKGKMVIGGSPKANKSFVALNIALNLSRGEHIFRAVYANGTPVLPVHGVHRVLYVEQEIGEDGLQRRLRGMTAGSPSGLDFYIKARDMNLRMDTPEGRDLIERELAECRPEVVILDPLAKFHLLDENAAQDMGAVMRVGDRWIEQYGTSIIWVHHTAKDNFNNPRRGGDRLRGSSAIYGDADTILEVVRKSSQHAREPVLELNFELRQGEPIEHPVFVRRRLNGLCEYIGESYLPRSLHGPAPKEPESKFKEL